MADFIDINFRTKIVVIIQDEKDTLQSKLIAYHQMQGTLHFLVDVLEQVYSLYLDVNV